MTEGTVKREFNDIGEKITIEVQLKYEDKQVSMMLSNCGYCPVGFRCNGTCGGPRSADWVRPGTCKLQEINIVDIISNLLYEDSEKRKLEMYSKYHGTTAVNDYGEVRFSNPRSIIFNNGFVASIIDTPEEEKKYSVAVCDYNGFFDWDLLNNYGATDGRFHCDNIDEVIVACEIIRNIPKGGK